MIRQTKMKVVMKGERERRVERVVGVGGVARQESEVSSGLHFVVGGGSILDYF